MKIGIILLFVVAVTGQNSASITDGLLEAQDELTLGHEFFETALFLNRDQMSAYMYSINRPLIDSHMDAFESMGIALSKAFEQLDALEVNERTEECLASVRNRINLQQTR